MIARGAVGSAQIAKNAIGLAQINESEIQARIAGACPVGQYLRGIQSDGTVSCEPFLSPNVVTTVDDPVNSVGSDTSIAIGADGLPIISYRDETAAALKVLKCGNASCTVGNSTITIDDPAGSGAGAYSSIAIGSDGMPVISYFDNVLGLKSAHCGDPACVTGFNITVLDPGAVGWFTSLAIGSDGLPIISYKDFGTGRLKVAHCVNVHCNAGTTSVVVDGPPASVGSYTSIVIGVDGMPVISYVDDSAQALKVAHCGNLACTAGNVKTTIDDPTDQVGYYNSIGIGGDGLPVISYQDASVGALKVAHCGDAACAGGGTVITVVDNNTPGHIVGFYTALAIGSDGLPVISHHDGGVGSLKVAHCANPACTGTSALATVDRAAGIVGQYTSIAVAPDGLPVISYQDGSNHTLKVAKCGTRTCQ
jgi:hypothetical protein